MSKLRFVLMVMAVLCALFMLSACGSEEAADAGSSVSAGTEEKAEATGEEQAPGVSEGEEQAPEVSEGEGMLQLMIGDTAVEVAWEDNQAVEDLQSLCEEEPLTISMSMHGGFEQVGPIGTSLTSSDEQTTTSPGDIVLYSGDQLVIFYGSNSWAYTRLGRITDLDAEELAELLGNGDVTVTLRLR